jgi:hypothetical protein
MREGQAVVVSERESGGRLAPQRYAIRRGRLRLIPVREVERWLDANASRVLEETR